MRIAAVDLADISLFEGLDAAALEEIRSRAQPRRFRARSFICRQGEAGDSLLVILNGLAQVVVEQPEGAVPVARLRRGDVVGEMSLLTGEVRSASVRALVPTELLELSQDAFAALAPRYPVLLANLGRILSQRLSRANVQRLQSQRRGEAVALVVGARGAPLAADIIEATRAASPGAIAALDLSDRGLRIADCGLRTEAPARAGPPLTLPDSPPSTVEAVLSRLDDLLSAHAVVVAVVGADHEQLPLLLEHVDRTVVLASEVEVSRPAAILGPTASSAEVVLIAEARQTPDRIGGLPIVRVLDPAQLDREIAWLGRHLARTKLGLALGAGGAKGYAHVGALHVLQQAGCTIDYVAGSSIGAVVGAWLALGMDAAEIEATMRRAFTPENVEAMFKSPATGRAAGLEVMTRLWRETTSDRSFSDLAIPFTAMTVDLNTGRPAPMTEGPLWQALLAAVAIPGLYPPYEYREQRLVDGVALVPVPTEAVLHAGADIALSVNVMNREQTAGTDETSPEPPSADRNLRTLDALLDVMELTWRDSSIRQAALADVVVTPRFPPASWRSFHLADAFLAAGRAAAEAQLERLRALAPPQSGVQAFGRSGVRVGEPEGLNAGTPERPNEFTLDDLKQIMVRLGVLRGRELPDDLNASFETIGLDSIAFLEIQIEMEQRYGFRISHEEAQQIRTLGDAVAFVNRRLTEASG